MNIKRDLSFSERIKKIISLVGSAEKLAYNSGMSSRVIGQYLSGKTDPTRKKLIALAEAAGVNIEWLATGEGLMREGDREVFTPALLTLIIEVLEDHEIALGKKLTAVEKAEFINNASELCYDADPNSPQTKILIRDTIREVYNFLSSLDRMIKTKEGRVRARKIIRREFGKVLSKEETKIEVDEFISSRILKDHLK